MASRRREFKDPPTWLGGAWDAVEKRIQSKIADEVAVFCPFTIPAATLITESVEPEILRVLTLAKFYKRDSYDNSVGTIPFTSNVGFRVDFTDAVKALVPNPQHIKISSALLHEITLWHEQMVGIYKKWMLVRAVADYFNRFATGGAVRSYWPVMMSLLPAESSKLRELHEAGIGSHAKEPSGIGKMLPLCRETASVVSAGQLLPERATEKSLQVKCEIKQSSFWHTDYTGTTHEIDGAATVLEF